MDPDKHREIARKGGHASHAAGTAHEFNSEEAKRAGSKGGSKHSREHMAAIGRKGAEARARNRKVTTT